VGSLGTGTGEMLASDEEREILAEFDAPADAPSRAAADQGKPVAGKPARAEPAVRTPEDDVLAEFDTPAPPPAGRKERGAAPEAG
jgi:hypothetical protein